MSVTSPMILAIKPKRGKGVRRLNKMPIVLGASALALVIAVVAYTYQQRMARQQEQAAEAETSTTKGSADRAKDFFNTRSQHPDHQPPGEPAINHVAPVTQTQASDPVGDGRKRAWGQYYQQVAALQQAKADAAAKAMTADTELSEGSNASSGGISVPSLPGGVSVGTTGAATPGLPSAGTDAGAQAEKRAFLNQGGDTLGMNEDLLASLHGPKLDTVMQGTAISGVMIGGLTSDQPGMVIGQISDDIFDSAGLEEKPLIPQGSRVVGQYDNSVSQGQERVGIIWNRIIFPDTSSIQLGSMEGADQGGYAGFKDQVNTHFWDKFLAATMISIGGAAAQVAQPQQSAFSGYSPSSVATGSLTQQYSQLGQEYARAGLSVPNTIEIRPGYRFTIMVNKDMHLPVYIDRRNAATRVSAGPILQ